MGEKVSDAGAKPHQHAHNRRDALDHDAWHDRLTKHGGIS